MISSMLQDMAAYAVLWTPSWKAVSDEEIVPMSVIDRIRASGDPKAFRGGAKEKQAIGCLMKDLLKALISLTSFLKMVLCINMVILVKVFILIQKEILSECIFQLPLI